MRRRMGKRKLEARQERDKLQVHSGETDTCGSFGEAEWIGCASTLTYNKLYLMRGPNE
jgi:hypothetical protein